MDKVFVSSWEVTGPEVSDIPCQSQLDLKKQFRELQAPTSGGQYDLFSIRREKSPEWLPSSVLTLSLWREPWGVTPETTLGTYQPCIQMLRVTSVNDTG